jgi:hypothetical protein
MRNLPADRKWSSLALFPFKVYTVVALFGFLASRGVPRPRNYSTDGETWIVMGYFLCFLILLVGALIQATTGSRKAALSSVAFAVTALIIGLGLAPSLANP